ncbi:TetR/AcrR family transcriptional regulator C-terminal domain-containing protein [Sphingomonas albertensis]|uniref:TetR/AcrR family transcriptional regulator C-terminal domain-containing protein n=1 Tax=Sphingomonas albertensis TaxID=2762591 RepID=A0ABR7ALU0_9SPHN|nr:TetR/AcrR family transcriptional regulator C-terminal domain-containing protein [Sphingomonas albertensis]MBC3941424.1 TetR/AcrR family transcriptional regulator C-terminal domain-containing protein [Sphingomonas albertensis]
MAIDKNVVIQTALVLLDEVGSDGLTMRALAKALNVQAPTLYWHFPSKQDLLEQMADALIAPVLRNVNVNAAPDDVLRSLAGALRAALLSRRDGARIYAGTYVMGDNVLGVAEIALGALLRKGIDACEATDAMFNLVYYVLGFTIEEQGFDRRWSEKSEGSSVRRQFLGATEGRFPNLSRNLDAILTNSFDNRFASGLTALLYTHPFR